MALLHQAQLVPSKLELLSGWLPQQPWFRGPGAGLTAVGAYRFDDPAGQVGIETHVVLSADGDLWQVPLTYRAAPADAAESTFVGTMQHSVLGERFVYDGCSDPVYVATLAATILTGGREADLEVATGTSTERRAATTWVKGSGTPGTPVPPVSAFTTSTEGTATVIRSGGLELVVLRQIDSLGQADSSGTLTGTWSGRDTQALLAFVR